MKAALAALPGAPLWYPGAEARYEEFLAAHPDCELIAPRNPRGATYSAPSPSRTADYSMRRARQAYADAAACPT